MDDALSTLLVCPSCKGALRWDPAAHELICPSERRAYPVREGVPVMLTDEARALAADEESA